MQFGSLEYFATLTSSFLVSEYNICAQLLQEQAEEKNRQVQMKETIVDLEEQVNTLGRKLTAADGEIACLKKECSMVR